jgi:putative FmdB family regulatory protein
MPLYSFKCESHGEHDILSRKFEVPETSECPKCGKETTNVLTAPAIIENKLDWNDKASDYQRDPYTQAKAQLRNLDREDQLTRGAPHKEWSEAQVLETARQIDRQNRGKDKPMSVANKSRLAKARKVLEQKADAAGNK